jgi:signal transduction histidine kinase
LILNKALVSVKSLVDDCLSVLVFKAQEKGIELSLTEGTENQVSIETDGNRVKQIIINLLSNAIKYTVQGHVRVSITKDGKASTVNIEVEDTGVGMTKL